MAQIFYVHCPACQGKFPCHPELWQVEYDLLCPFCGTSFAQETSPLIITAAGERRPGREVASAPAARPAGRAGGPTPDAPDTHAESM